MSTLPYIRVLLQVRNDKHKLSVPKPVQPTTVFFSHLNTTVGDEQLKNACAAYGRVISAHCVNSQTGCRQGYAVYASYQEAYQAHLQANIELIPAKVLGIHPSVPSTIRIEDLRQFIRNNRPDLMEKDLLDDSQYYFEIMDSDFNEYIRVHEDTAISDMSRLRICPKFEVDDNLDTFSTLSHPFPHRRSHHTAVATNLFQNLGNQPLNSTFDENSLSGQITSFNEPVRDAPDLIAAIGTGRPSHGRLYSENAETPPRIVHDLIDVNYQPPAHASVNDLDDNRNTFSLGQPLPPKSPNPTWAQIAGTSKSPSPANTPETNGNVAFEKALITEVMKCSRDQRSNGQNRSVIWYAVAANLLDGGHGQKLTSDFCRQQFEKLARDYLKCKQTGDSQWHYYRVFCDRVEPALGSKWLCDLIAAGDCGQVELIQPKAIHLEQQLTEAADVHALKQLVSAVIRNGDMILLSNASEYEFWQKISYELTKYVSPMNKEAWTTWRTHFYDGFHKFLNLSDSANSSNWPLYQDYSSISGPLLEELKARKDNLNEEEQSRRASSASPPENAFKLVASYRPRERHRPLYWDTSDIPRKLQLVRLITTRLPALEDPMAREWSDMKRIMVSTGYLTPGAKIDLRSYFISMVRNYVETMTVATSNTEGNKMCPYFHLMKKLDLGPFLPKTGPCTERDAYLKLKAKFVK